MNKTELTNTVTLKKMTVFLFIVLQANVASKLGLSYYSVLYFLFVLVLLNLALLKEKSKQAFTFLVSIALLILFRKANGIMEGSFQQMAILCFPALLVFILPKDAESLKNYSFYRLVLKSIAVLFCIDFLFSFVEFFLHISILGYTNDTYGLHTGTISRATALFGASLANALIISGFLFLVLNSNLKDKYKYSIWSVGALSLMCFQGRIAMIVSFIYLFIYLFSHMKKSIRKNISLIVIACGIICMVTLAFYMGFGERLLNSGVFDESSSTVRSRMFEYLWDNYKLREFLWGMSMKSIQFLMVKMQVLIIECFFVIHLLFFGLVFLVVFYLQYALLIKMMLIEYDCFFKIFAVPAYILIAFTNNSFASGYVSLSMFLLLVKLFTPSIFNKVVPHKYLTT